MITKRIIPCLDIQDGRVVKGVNFLSINDAGDPVELARKYAADGADELVFLDITASSDNRLLLKEVVRRVANEIFIPFTVGGGIHTIAMMQDVLNLGADKISLNTAALHDPDLVRSASHHFGCQCVVVAVDIKRVQGQVSPVFSTKHAVYNELKSDDTTTHEVFSHGGRRNLGLDAMKWMRHCEMMGAGELLITSMDRDGTNDGYELDVLERARQQVRIPIIASGGAGTVDHIASALQVVDAALMASLLHYGVTDIPTIKRALQQQAIPVRMDEAGVVPPSIGGHG